MRIILWAIVISTTACVNGNYTKDATSTAEASLDFLAPAEMAAEGGLDKNYWYSGEAEVSRFELQQNRYRHIHPGELIQIFVTEDFLTGKQVKNESYSGDRSIPILKLNEVRRFTTGFYDYSIMTSVFSPANGDRVEKVTFSSQDWCGQSFMQANRQGEQYKVQMRSYFESEGDQEVMVRTDLLEDEIPNRIRIDPERLPVGDVQVLPSMMFLRLKHQPISTYAAKLSLVKGAKNWEYILEYAQFDRKVHYIFEADQPHRLIEMSDGYPSAFDNQMRLTQAKKSSEIKSAYWMKNAATDAIERDKLLIRGFPSTTVD